MTHKDFSPVDVPALGIRYHPDAGTFSGDPGTVRILTEAAKAVEPPRHHESAGSYVRRVLDLVGMENEIVEPPPTIEPLPKGMVD